MKKYNDTLEIGCAEIMDWRMGERIDIKITTTSTRVMDMRDMRGFSDNSFVFIKASAVFEHVSFADQIKTVKEMYRILAPNGLVWLQLPDVDYWRARLFSPDEKEREWAQVQLEGGKRDEFDFHRGLIRMDDLKRLLRKHGFEIVWAKNGSECAGSIDLVAEAIK